MTLGMREILLYIKQTCSMTLLSSVSMALASLARRPRVARVRAFMVSNEFNNDVPFLVSQ